MKKYAILTDSSCDIDDKTAQELGIFVLRMPITIDEKEYDSCLETTVDYLINNNYISTDETKEDGSKTITNDTLGEDDPNYYVNNLKVYIYVENNIVYAKLQTS